MSLLGDWVYASSIILDIVNFLSPKWYQIHIPSISI